MKPIYVASRTHHAEMWEKLRWRGANIISSWIGMVGDNDPVGPEAIGSLWRQISLEIDNSGVFVLYAEPEDFPLKGALIETGYALACKIPVILCAPGCVFPEPNYRPIGSWINHPSVRRIDDIEVAMIVAEKMAREKP